MKNIPSSMIRKSGDRFSVATNARGVCAETRKKRPNLITIVRGLIFANDAFEVDRSYRTNPL